MRLVGIGEAFCVITGTRLNLLASDSARMTIEPGFMFAYFLVQKRAPRQALAPPGGDTQ